MSIQAQEKCLSQKHKVLVYLEDIYPTHSKTCPRQLPIKADLRKIVLYLFCIFYHATNNCYMLVPEHNTLLGTCGMLLSSFAGGPKWTLRASKLQG